MNTRHKIRLLDADELATYTEYGWTTCTRDRCRETHAMWIEHTDAAGKRHGKRVCQRHGKTFATRYGLIMPVPTTEAAGPDTFTVTTRLGRAFTLCARCRHWIGRSSISPPSCLDGCRCQAACHRRINRLEVA